MWLQLFLNNVVTIISKQCGYNYYKQLLFYGKLEDFLEHAQLKRCLIGNGLDSGRRPADFWIYAKTIS